MNVAEVKHILYILVTAVVVYYGILFMAKTRRAYGLKEKTGLCL